MIVYVDEKNQIRAVNSTQDTSLKAVYIDEENPTFPFKGWSTSKICCYKVEVYGGVVTMMTPYVDSRNLEMADNIGHQIDRIMIYKQTKKAYYGEKEKTFYDVPKGSVVVVFDNYSGPYSVYKVEDRVTVTFDTLEEETNITISIQ